MANFYDSLKNLISQDMISQASKIVEENHADVAEAIASIRAGLLSVLLKKGHTPQIRNILEEAGALNIVSDINPLYEEKPSFEQQKIGDNFLQELLGDKAANFSDSIADSTGISKVATNRLVSIMAPVVAGFLGEKMVKEKHSLDSILKQLDSEKTAFSGLIPSGMANAFGLSSVLGKQATPDTNATEPKKKSGFGWLWTILFLLAILLLFFWWRSCSNKNVENTSSIPPAIETDSLRQGIDSDSIYENKEAMEITLPNGVKLQAYKGGVEDKMIQYLNSDDYKKATEKELQEKWFEFDNIDFEFGSTTELKENSKAQLNNIVEILKYYKDAKINIAGFADKKGSEATNMKVSQERAKAIESMLDKAGVGSQVVKVEGYGEEYAKHSAKESDEARSEDRDIALRFVK